MPSFGACWIHPHNTGTDIGHPTVFTRSQIDEMFDILRKAIEITQEELLAEGLWDGAHETTEHAPLREGHRNKHTGAPSY